MSRVRRPSAALIVSILALVAALVVPAGAQIAVKALTKSEKRTVRKIANGQITGRAPGLSVASAKRADDAAEARTPARLVVNDPTPGDANGRNVDVFTAGAFTVRARCFDNYNGTAEDDAILELNGPSGTSFAYPGGISGVPSSTLADLGSTFSSTPQVNSKHVIAVAPNGQVISVLGSTEVGDGAGDCVYGVTALGP